jgi:hypothetical protein
VSKLFTICLDLMFASKYMEFSLICSLPKSLLLIHVLLTTMYNLMYNTLMLPIVHQKVQNKLDRLFNSLSRIVH